MKEGCTTLLWTFYSKIPGFIIVRVKIKSNGPHMSLKISYLSVLVLFLSILKKVIPGHTFLPYVLLGPTFLRTFVIQKKNWDLHL